MCIHHPRKKKDISVALINGQPIQSPNGQWKIIQKRPLLIVQLHRIGHLRKEDFSTLHINDFTTLSAASVGEVGAQRAITGASPITVMTNKLPKFQVRRTKENI